jgi:hypothetical protein
VFCEGIGSGKSYKTSIIALYFEHLLLCLRNPQDYLGVGAASKIAIMNMSVSERNAIKVIFAEIKQKIDICEWFQERGWEYPDARVPDPNCLSELRFKNNTFIMPGSSSWRTAVGYHILMGIMDEAGSYRKTDNSDQGEDIYNAMLRRLGSRFEDRGAIVIAGSPLYADDFLARKLKEADIPGSGVFGKRRSLWEAKYPDWTGEFFYVDAESRLLYEKVPEGMKEADLIKIPRVPFIHKAFVANPTKALRDYGALPSIAINVFFENPRIIMEQVNRSRTEAPIDEFGRFKPWFKPDNSDGFCSVHIDLALSGDAAGFAMAHNVGETAEGGVLVKVDLVIRLVGTTESPIRIAKMRDIIFALTSLGFSIDLITYDGFQSSDSIQILQGKGYEVDYLSVDRTMLPYSNLKEAINENRLDYYCVSPEGTRLQDRVMLDNDELSPSEVLVKELMRLEDIQGKKVDHPPKGSKDVADAVAGAVHNVIVNAEYSGSMTVDI